MVDLCMLPSDPNQTPRIAGKKLARILATNAIAGLDILLAAGIIARTSAGGGGMILLLRRRRDSFLGGMEDLPGGKVEAGETLLDTLCREVYEETGRRVTEVFRLVGTFDYENDGRLSRQFTFAIRVDHGPIVLSPNEHDRVRWVSISDLSAAEVSAETARMLQLWSQHFQNEF